MALVKVSLMSELAVLRLFQVGRRADNHYQQATQEYCAQLRELYRASVRERRRRAVAARRARKQASAATSDTFKLALTADESVPGISLARSSLPLAEQGDQVQLLRVPEQATSDATGAEPELLTRGVVLLVNEQQVRIKFQEPLRRAAAAAKKPDAKRDETAERADEIGDSGDREPVALQEDAREEQKVIEKKPREPEVICFRVQFDLAVPRTDGAEESNSERESQMSYDDEHGQLVEEVLHQFVKLKCNQALHRNLMGLYDERTEASVSERTRVLPNAALGQRPVRPNGQQRAAIEQALKRRLTLIEGPPGSGKTLVGALIAANACRLRGGKGRVLVCSPLQSTVDKLTELLLQLLAGHQQVVKLPENARASTRNPRLARRAPTGKRRARSTIPSPLSNGTRKARDSFLSQSMADDATAYDSEVDGDDDDDNLRQHEANRAHLDKIVDDEIYLQAYARSKDTLGHNHEQLHAHAYRMVTSYSPLKRREMEAKMISKANIVCCTLVQAGSYLLRGAEFDLLILDDVQLTSELDCLVAIMTSGIKQVTLLGDTRRRIRLARSRLGTQQNNTTAKETPVGTGSGAGTNSKSLVRDGKRSGCVDTPGSGQTESSRSSNSGESFDEISKDGARLTPTNGVGQKSRGPPHGVSLEPGNLFERLLLVGLPAVDLRVQYRCHATLSNFFNHHFYAGRLKDDRKTNEKLSAEINTSLLVREQNFAWMPNRKYLTGLFWASSESAGSSELEIGMNFVLNKLLRDENIQESRIGVIYNKHSLLTRARRNVASAYKSSDLKQATIDGFIGQERDFIILVAGAGNGAGCGEDETSYLGLTSEINCDFRSNDAALNWAITRAKLGLFIVAETTNKEALEGGRDCGSWIELVKYYDTNKLTNSSANQ